MITSRMLIAHFQLVILLNPHTFTTVTSDPMLFLRLSPFLKRKGHLLYFCTELEYMTSTNVGVK